MRGARGGDSAHGDLAAQLGGGRGRRGNVVGMSRSPLLERLRGALHEGCDAGAGAR